MTLPTQREETAPDFNRVPPQDVEAEQSVLGGMLLSKDAIADVTAFLKGPEFYKPAHEIIFQAILALYAKGEPADPITVAAELTKTGDIGKVGGASYLHTLVQTVPTAANAEYYAEIVSDLAGLRRLSEAGLQVHQLAHSRVGEPAEIRDQAEALIHAATQTTAQAQPYADMGTVFEESLDLIERNNNPDKDSGVLSGIEDLDSLLNGFKPGQMIVVAARPAMGKSNLALNFVRNCSIKQGKPSVVFSMEMSRAELGMRMLSAETRVAMHHMTSPNGMTDDDWTRIAQKTPIVSQAPITIDDTASQTIMYIRSQCRKLKAQGGLELVVIDYMQLMESGLRKDNRQQEVSDISRNIKLLAKELEVPVIALSQLNRGPEQRTDKKPVISDLRESGSIEQDADIVILVHREDAYEKESPRAGEADLIVAKHRNGPTATVTTAFQGHFARFADMAQT